ncbi:MAG: prepilin-type N-terminal cleavage/methylation domain-containing protein [Synechococcales cyanobacterium RU_4_20]|nr:prepilin-type N-terminal cleavage/methylation domain-containing protein [Synechococcales cyanobacterium RU_4_20]NJR69249.1 prepilin-type N-terminal cleavage/methylation domain-containing protein [Synechococcales cyanobacterium CRU_2_2]
MKDFNLDLVQFKQLQLKRFFGQSLRSQERLDSRGFTLTEVLVVVIMAGVLAGIAAPGWLAFMNRQRVGGAQTELLQFMREAQAQSIAKRSSYGIEIAQVDDQATIRSFSAKGARTDEEGNPNGTGELDAIKIAILKEEKLSSGGEAELEVLTSDGGTRVFFNFDGSVDPDQITLPYALSVQLPDQPNSRRCVIIETLLGSMREGSGATECPVS